jgi:mono/diheme cytochrome c family protein
LRRIKAARDATGQPVAIMTTRIIALSVAFLALLALWMGQAGAQTSATPSRPDRAAGRDLADEHCARCHAVGRRGASPMAKAPPFRDIHRKYPVDYLEEAFGEGTTGNHLGMPDFTFDPRQVTDLLAYIKSLSNKPSARR